MDGLNQVTLIGSAGKDAETKLVGENSQVATFSLATNRSYKDKNGEKKTQTEWHNIEVWAETAVFAGNFVKKGSLVLVQGQIRYDKYTGKDGLPKERAKIVADRIQLFPKKDSGTNGADATAKTEGVNTAAKQAEEYATSNSTGSNEFVPNNNNEDLPF
jgi:single-strand DNA-binding protein